MTFIECERAWIAIHPLAAAEFRRDNAMTGKIREGEKAVFRGHYALSTRGNGESFCGLAIEIGEKERHGNFARFQEQVLRAEVDQSKHGEWVVQYKAADGSWLGIHWDDDPFNLSVWRDGERHDLSEHASFLYRGGPVESKWGSGEITVEAGGARFRCRVSESEEVEFENGV